MKFPQIAQISKGYKDYIVSLKGKAEFVTGIVLDYKLHKFKIICKASMDETEETYA